jgi:hypothetical protein
VWGKLVASLVGLPLPRPSGKALRDVRRRLGAAPFQALFEALHSSQRHAAADA